MAAMIAVQSLIERNVLYGHTVPGPGFSVRICHTVFGNGQHGLTYRRLSRLQCGA